MKTPKARHQLFAWLSPPRVFFLACFFHLACPPAFAANTSAPTDALPELVVNGYRTGVLGRVILPNGDGDILLNAADIARLPFSVWYTPEAERKLRGMIYLSLTASGWDFELKDNHQTLALSVPTAALGQTSLSTREPPPVTPTTGNGVYLNYDLSAWFDQDRARQAAALEAVAFSRWGSLLIGGSYQSASGEWVRTQTNYLRDFPQRGNRLLIGDTTLIPGVLEYFIPYAGVTYGTNASVTPYLSRLAAPSIAGFARAPAEVELLGEERRSVLSLPPGEFTVEELPVINGAGELSARVRDALGREMIIHERYYYSPELLKPGRVEYSLAAGRLRDTAGSDYSGYGDAFASATVFRGITNGLTLGGNITASEASDTVGVSIASTLFNKRLLLVADGAFSRSESKPGRALSLALEHRSRRLNIALRSRYFSRDFQFLDQREDRMTVHDIRLGLPLNRWGNFALAWREERWRDIIENPTRRIVTASWQFSIRKVGSLVVRYTRNRNGVFDQLAEVALSIPLGGYGSAYASASELDGEHRFRLQSQHSLPNQATGWSYRAGLERDYSGVKRADALARRRSEYGDLEVEAGSRSDAVERSFVRFGGSGSVGVVDGAGFAGRRIYNAFTLVRAPGLPDVPIMINDLPAGKTTRNDTLLLSTLSPYFANRIGVDVAKLPLTLSVAGQHRHTLSPYFRSGNLLDLNVAQVHRYVLRLVNAGGHPVPAGSRVEIDGEGNTYYVAANGRTYLETGHGTIAGTAYWNDSSCRFRFEAAPDDAVVSDLGNRLCKTGEQP